MIKLTSVLDGYINCERDSSPAFSIDSSTVS